MSSHGCPVLHELEVTEDYQPEHENPPVLSGGDYDISAIRDCAEECKVAALAWSRGEHLRSIALILGLAPGDTAEIDNTVRELIRSRDEWKTRACQEELRADALEIERDRYRAALELIDRATRDYGIGIGATCNNTAHYALEPVQKEAAHAEAGQ